MKIQDIITESERGQRQVPVSAYFKYHDQFTPAREAFDQRRRIYRGIYVYDTDFFINRACNQALEKVQILPTGTP